MHPLPPVFCVALLADGQLLERGFKRTGKKNSREELILEVSWWKEKKNTERVKFVRKLPSSTDFSASCECHWPKPF